MAQFISINRLPFMAESSSSFVGEAWINSLPCEDPVYSYDQIPLEPLAIPIGVADTSEFDRTRPVVIVESTLVDVTDLTDEEIRSILETMD